MSQDKKIIVTLGTCGISAGAAKLAEELKSKNNVTVKTTSCIGLCALEPTVFVEHGSKITAFSDVRPGTKDVDLLVQFHKTGTLDAEFGKKVIYDGDRTKINEVLFKGQKRIVLRNAGWVDPLNIDDYIARGGYSFKATKEQIFDVVKNSGLRGRGGAGFPTYKKWEILAAQRSDEKYIVCNGDEGDPGAFMDRAVLEGDPHSVLEGMQIACFAAGATKCFIYVRAEYPLAVRTIKQAIKDATVRGFLPVPVEVREGAGAFVCGEETALIASIEGRRGMPRMRPPYPAESGLWGKPTIINNVETFAALPWICTHPGEYEKIGYKNSKGTKVFALAGKVKKGGLVEVPFGLTLRDLIYNVGGGVIGSGVFRAVQLGGPSGGCLPDSKLDLPIDYEALKESGAIVGSGGAVIMDDTSCMVDIARFFLSFTSKESCGKCTFCRVGTTRMLDVLDKISKGKATQKDMETLNELSEAVSKLSLCGLGQTAPNPVLTTLKYFAEEYKEHIEHKKCRAGICAALFVYEIDEQKCVKCKACVKVCPVEAISKDIKIDQAKCIKCGQCFKVCKFSSVLKG